MNVPTFERAKLVDFVYRKARDTGSLDCMKAIAYVIRNRVGAAWGDGTWLSVMEGDSLVAGNDFQEASQMLNPQDRLLQLLLRDVDDIYLGSSEDDTRRVVDKALYYQRIDLPTRPWFNEHILADNKNHARSGQIGPIALFR